MDRGILLAILGSTMECNSTLTRIADGPTLLATIQAVVGLIVLIVGLLICIGKRNS